MTPLMSKKLMICPFVYTQYWHWTDGRTDRIGKSILCSACTGMLTRTRNYKMDSWTTPQFLCKCTFIIFLPRSRNSMAYISSKCKDTVRVKFTCINYRSVNQCTRTLMLAILEFIFTSSEQHCGAYLR